MKTIGEIEDRNREIKHKFFEADTMRFFHSRVCEATVTHLPNDGALFVTSERFDIGNLRLYTIRLALPNGAIRNAVNEFQTYASVKSAMRDVRLIVQWVRQRYHAHQCWKCRQYSGYGNEHCHAIDMGSVTYDHTGYLIAEDHRYNLCNRCMMDGDRRGDRIVSVG